MRTSALFAAVVALSVVAADALAFPGSPAAIAGRTPKSASPGCGSCHGGSADATLTVAISGQRVLAAGTSATYTVTTSRANTPDGTVMGVDIAASGSPTPLSVVAGMPTVLEAGSGEVIHSTSVGPLRTMIAGSATYQFTFTMPAGAAAGDARTLYAVSRLANSSSVPAIYTSWQFADNYVVTTPLATPATLVSPSQSVNAITLSWSGGGPFYRLVYKPGTTAPANESDGTTLDLAAVTSTTVASLAGGSPYSFAVYSRSEGNFAYSATAATLVASTSATYAYPPIFTVAGGGAGDGSFATDAMLSDPRAVIVDASGNTYIADAYNHRVRRVNAAGIITTIAGNGLEGPSGDGGPAKAASVGFPSGLARDSAGNLYISTNNRVRRVDAAGTITTVVGGGSGFGGDLGPAASARLNLPAGLAVDAAGNLYIADMSNHRIRKVTAGVISTVAGNGAAGYFQDDGTSATGAGLNTPQGVAVDAAGNLFIADTGNNRIRRVDALTGIITTVAGNGAFGYTADGIAATTSRLASPVNVTLDAAGNLLIADSSNNRVRKVDAVTGVISTVAGCAGSSCYNADLYPGTSTTLTGVSGVAVDGNGKILIAERDGNRVRRVFPYNGDTLVETIAGQASNTGYIGDLHTGPNAVLKGPLSVAVDAAGNLLIADTQDGVLRSVSAATKLISSIYGTSGSPQGVATDSAGNIYWSDAGHVVRKVEFFSGIVSTVAGRGDAGISVDGLPATSAPLNRPQGVAVDAAGNVFIADSNNHRIVKVSIATGTLVTVAGSGSGGDGGLAKNASLVGPNGIAVDRAGNLFITDTGNRRIRRVDALTGIITTIAGNGSGTYSGDGGSATSAGLEFPTGIAVDGMSNVYIAESDSVTHRIRKVSAATGLIATVAGSGTRDATGDGGPATAAGLWEPAGVAIDGAGNLYIADTGNNRIRRVETTASVGVPVAPTSPSYGMALTLATTVADGATVPAGPVVFRDGESVACIAQVSSGTASCDATGLGAGPHRLTAEYGGGAATLSARSAFLDLAIAKASQSIVFAALPDRVQGSAPFTVSASVPTWNSVVTFSSLTPAACASSGANGATVTLIATGACTIAADQPGDANLLAASRVTRTFTVLAPGCDVAAPGDCDGDGIPNATEVSEGRNPLAKDNDVFASSRLFAMQQYRDFLGREGDAGGIQFYMDLLNNGTATRETIIASFLASPEFAGGLPSIIRLYFSFFGRIPDYGGLTFQVTALRQGTPLEAIAQNFYNSPEFTNKYGALTNDTYINLVYQNVLGRAPDPGGFAFYKNLLDTNAITKGQMMIGFSESPEFQQITDNEAWAISVYVGLLRRTPEQSGLDFYVNLLDTNTPRIAIIPGFFNSPEYHNRFLP